ncbi:uncharacterized protein A1O9_00902 [Exophiala aquamarina CBS 119918]|uniref:Uncharacterized protein n=1 Tax=Exophiala aquamarina CBS 119918 TaxID=1182545 RepID=A0A072PUA1_9EURO|nr:uncharacterized protein A1O9_00902 [Exophiala aquamarina CBS 119918]KEF62928.1 hypothetical protein A1O9_00902 [Exophiala aquamarina CBS 119918]
MGYEGDGEVLRPDHYEEIDSDFEDDRNVRQQWPDTDEELARKLGLLVCDPEHGDSPWDDDAEHGKKRRSKEMESEMPSQGVHSDLEISELVEGQPDHRPARKRRKRPSQQSMAHRLGRKHVNGTWSDSSERTDDTEMPLLLESSCSGTPEVTPAPEGFGRDDDDAMDVG